MSSQSTIANQSSRFDRTTPLLASLVTLISLIVLVGWVADIPVLKSMVPGLVTMKVNTAVNLLLFSLALQALNRRYPLTRVLLILCCFVAASVAFLTELEYLTGHDLRIDNLLIADLSGILYPGRMAPSTIFCFLSLALSFLLLEYRKVTYFAHVLLSLVIVIGMVTLGGYLYGTPRMWNHAPYPVVALHTAIALALLSLGALLRTYDTGAMRVLTAPTTGGWVARRLVPTAMVLPMLVGLAVVTGQRASIYSAAFSIALTVAADIALMTAIVWSVSALLDRSDSARQISESAASDSATRFRELSDAMPQIVFTARPDGAIDYLNARWYEFTGLPKTFASPSALEPVIHPDDLSRSRIAYTTAIRSAQPHQIEFRFKDRRTQSYRWFLCRALPVRDPSSNSVVCWYGTCTDIDEQRRSADERRELLDAERVARAEAERLGRVKDDFLATLSHELRTPLNAILGWSSILADRQDMDREAVEGLEVIARNARAQTHIVNDLLDMNRIVTGKMRLEPTPTDFTTAVRAAVESLQPAIDAKSLRLHLNLPVDPVTVSGDPDRLRQVVWNLLSNAVRFTPRAGEIHITLAPTSEDAVFAIADTGQGIPRQFLPQLFQNFHQADRTSTRRFGGLGLGLAIVRQIVELHGGTVSADSPGEGQGATFKVNLPLISTPAPKPRPEPSTPATNLQGLRALIVEDESDTRKLIRRFLQHAGASVVAACSVSDAITQLDAPGAHFDFLLSDIGMPDQDGYDLIRAIRSRPPERHGAIPAAALTAFASTDDRSRALDAGFQAHLPKPFTPQQLLSTAHTLADLAPSGRR